MSEPSQIAKYAAKTFELDHFGDWPGDDIAAVKFQDAIDAALKFHTESVFVGFAEAAGKPVGSFKTGGEWIDYIKGELAKKDKRIEEARRLIEKIGITGAERIEIIQAAEKWLEGKP